MEKAVIRNFESAGQAVLRFLYSRFGFGLWMVTRTEGDDWIVLQSEDHGYGVKPGRVFRWADSFCSEMVKGNGPRIAPIAEVVPAYAAAPIAREVTIKAYVGVPLTHADGTLFGTLCGIDTKVHSETLVEQQDLLELLAGLLGTLLEAEVKLQDEVRRAERLALEAHADGLTGLYNRRAWNGLLDREEERCRRYGHPAAVLLVDLDGLKQINDSGGHPAGDQTIAKAAEALKRAIRGLDVVARLGGDEFAILAVECSVEGSIVLEARVRSSLAAAGVAASVGLAMRDASRGLAEAVERADAQMYEEKRLRKAASPHR